MKPPELTGSRCRCAACKRTFRNLAGFDAHRPDRDGCGDPAKAGLVEQGGIWATPEGHVQTQAFAQRLKSARTAAHPVPQSDEQETDHA